MEELQAQKSSPALAAGQRPTAAHGRALRFRPRPVAALILGGFTTNFAEAKLSKENSRTKFPSLHRIRVSYFLLGAQLTPKAPNILSFVPNFCLAL